MYRTQIYLPKDLREAINQQISKKNESLAEYLRKAAEDRLKKDQKEIQNLKILAQNLGGGIKISNWRKMGRQEIINWQRGNRKDKS